MHMRYLFVLGVADIIVQSATVSPEVLTESPHIDNASALADISSNDQTESTTRSRFLDTPMALLWVSIELISRYKQYIPGFRSHQISESRDFPDEIARVLGWRSFPRVVMRENPDILKKQNMDAVDYIPYEYIPDQKRSDRLAEISRLENVDTPATSAPIEVRSWNDYVMQILHSEQISLVNYEVQAQRFKDLMAETSPNESVTKTMKQLEADSLRHGFPSEIFTEQYSPQQLAQDCIEVCGVYSLVVDLDFGYIQGMMDYCFAFKLFGKMSNEEAFYGLQAIAQAVARVSDGPATLDERSFIKSQLYIHMFAELNQLESPNVFEMIDTATTQQAEMLPGHLLSHAFNTFMLSAGFRGNPARVTPVDLAPVVDFVLSEGRPGLVACFFGGLQLNMAHIEGHLQSGRFFHAAEFVSDPFADGSSITVDDLLAAARAYMTRSVGSLSFRAAVREMEDLARDFIPAERER